MVLINITRTSECNHCSYSGCYSVHVFLHLRTFTHYSRLRGRNGAGNRQQTTGEYVKYFPPDEINLVEKLSHLQKHSKLVSTLTCRTKDLASSSSP